MQITIAYFRSFLLALIISAPLTSKTQNLDKAIEVTYAVYENGALKKDQDRSFIYLDDVVYLSNEKSKLRNYIDFKNEENITVLETENGLYKSVTPFDSLVQPELDRETATLLNYKCKHAVFKAFSNTIDVWYTNEAPVKGSIYSTYLPNEKSLVLKITFNGVYTFEASSIIPLESNEMIPYFPNVGEVVSPARIEELKIKSRYKTLTVFDHEQINFDHAVKNPVIANCKSNVTYRASKGTVIFKKITLPAEIEQGAYVHAKLTSWSNGDAYDRTGSIFILPGSTSNQSILNAFEKGVDVLPIFTDREQKSYQGFTSEGEYDCPIEVMRFFTSFGARHFNTLRPINNYPWADSVIYNQEVTPFIPTNEKEIWVGVFIGNYDKGGHKVNLDFNIYPSFEEATTVNRWVKPIFNTVNILEASGQNYARLFKHDKLEVTVEIPENIDDLTLYFTSTGHGGWGNGDEFNPKLNTILLDGKPYYNVIPWRTDCASYRFSNPASGNFGNGLSSSDLSRSNWCPATVTPPYIIPLANLKPGKHTFTVIIDQGEDEGNSFSHWSVSGILSGTVD